MIKKLVTLDQETADLLAGHPNQSAIIREAVRLYIGDILPETRQGLITSYKILLKNNKAMATQIDQMDKKIDYLARVIK